MVNIDIKYCKNYFTISVGEQIYRVNAPEDLIEVIPNNYELFFLKSKYASSQINISKIYLPNQKETCGLLFPVTRLDDSEDNINPEQSDNNKRYFNMYKYASYQILLKNFYTNGINWDLDHISDLYDDLFVLIFDKKYLKNFCIINYLPCLYRNGFLYYEDFFNDFKLKNPILKKDEKLYNFPHNIHFDKTFSDISNNKFLKKLYTKDLQSVNNYLAIFILMYQVIEMYISEIQKFMSYDIINSYTRGNIHFNTFKNDISRINTEENRISRIFQNIDTKNFQNLCKQYINSIFKNLSLDSNSHEFIYAFRNNIVHNYHSLINTEISEKEVIEIIEEFEIIVSELLIKKPLFIKDQIKEKAYYNYLKHPDNTSEENWFLAIKELQELFR